MNTANKIMIIITICLVVYFNRKFIKERLSGLPFKKRVILMLYFNAAPIIVIAAIAVYHVLKFVFP